VKYLWETFGESTPPSLNDHIARGIAGGRSWARRCSGWPARCSSAAARSRRGSPTTPWPTDFPGSPVSNDTRAR